MIVNGDYNKKLDDLRSSIRRSEGDPVSIEGELALLLDESEPDLVRDLLMSLSDEAHSGAMYALIHAAEKLTDHSDRPYTSTVLSLLPDLLATAPNWALMLVRRIMNTNEAYAELLREVAVAPLATKEAVRNVGLMNDAINPDFIPQSTKERLTLAAM